MVLGAILVRRLQPLMARAILEEGKALAEAG